MIVDGRKYFVSNFPVDANKFVNEPEIIVSALANKFESTFKLLIDEVAATIWLAARLVPVKFVTVVDPKVVEPFV
jgi:hypothetical protein